jgi:membrane-bound serine protease (ClpP class)
MYLEEEGTEIVEVHPSWSENLVRFITHPITSSLLLGIGFWAIIFAIRMPGLGAPEVVGTLFILVFFWGTKLAGLAEWTDALLILLGITFLLVEIFALPGFGIVGGIGFLSLIAGIVLALVRHPFLIPREELQRASHILVFSFTITLVLFLLSLKLLPRTRLWQNIVLPAQSESRIEDIRLDVQEGIAVSDLRPSGKARFNDKIYDVQTDGEYVKRGEKVKLLSIEGNIIRVRKI